MLLGIKRESFTPPEDQTWLGSAHGTANGDPVTLDGDNLVTIFTDGVVPSGLVLGQVTATTLYRKYVDANSDGTQTALGLLLTTKDLGGITAATVGPTPGALFWHGEVIEAKLPSGSGIDAAAKTDLKQIRFV